MSEALTRMFCDQHTRAEPRNLYSGEGAELYAALVADDRAEFAEVRLAAEGLGPGLRVGEIAAGEGRILFSLDSSKVDRYLALDRSPTLLAKLHSRAREFGITRDVETTCIDLLDWQPLEGSLDLLILGAGTIRLFPPDQRKQIFEIARTALRPSGAFYVSTAEPAQCEDRMVCLGQMTLQNQEVVCYFYDVAASVDARETGFVVVDVFPGRKPTRTYSSTVLNVSRNMLTSELQGARFTVGEVVTNRVESLGSQEDVISLVAYAGDR